MKKGSMWDKKKEWVSVQASMKTTDQTSQRLSPSHLVHTKVYLNRSVYFQGLFFLRIIYMYGTKKRNFKPILSIDKVKSNTKAYFKSVLSEVAQEIELFLEILTKIIYRKKYLFVSF